MVKQQSIDTPQNYDQTVKIIDTTDYDRDYSEQKHEMVRLQKMNMPGGQTIVNINTTDAAATENKQHLFFVCFFVFCFGERERETERQRDRETQREGDRQTDRQRQRETETERDRDRQTDRQRQRERQRQRQTDRDRDFMAGRIFSHLPKCAMVDGNKTQLVCLGKGQCGLVK